MNNAEELQQLREQYKSTQDYWLASNKQYVARIKSLEMAAVRSGVLLSEASILIESLFALSHTDAERSGIEKQLVDLGKKIRAEMFKRWHEERVHEGSQI